MAILVTGASGFIGSYFLREALGRGEGVIAYDINLPDPRLVGPIDGLNAVRGSVLESGRIVETIKNHDVKEIVHLASLLTMQSQRDPIAAVDVNIKGTINILEASRLFDINRIIFASSQAVYGRTAERLIDEDYPKKPCTIYGIFKLASELLGMNYNELYGIGFIALRFPLVYGMGKSRGFNLIERLIETGSATARGEQRYEPLYVKDAARALFSALRAYGVKHKAFNIGSGQLLSIWEILDIIRKFIPTASIRMEAGEDLSYCTRGLLNSERAQMELSFRPIYDFEKGVEDYLSMLHRK